MHGDIGFAAQQRLLQFLQEQSLAADARQRRVGFVALREHFAHFNAQIAARALQCAAHLMRLAQRQRAFARGDSDAHSLSAT